LDSGAHPAPPTRGVQEACLYVSDLDRAADFYRAALGLGLALSTSEARFLRTGPGSVLILFDRVPLETRESEIPAHGATGPGHVAIAVDDGSLPEWRAQLAAHAVGVEHEHTWPTGTQSIYFRDPDGNSIELMERRHYHELDNAGA